MVGSNESNKADVKKVSIGKPMNISLDIDAAFVKNEHCRH